MKSGGRKIVIGKMLVVLAVLSVFCLIDLGTVHAETSGDAYVNYDNATKTWTIGTEAVEKKIQLNPSGQYLLTSFKNKLTGREYVQGTQNSDEFQVQVGSTVYNGLTSGWVYDSHSISTLSQGELQLQVTFHNSILQVTRYYIVYPYTGAIREWSNFLNVSGSSQNFTSPYMFKQRVMQNDLADVDLQYMTGGGNFTGSGILKTVALTSTYARTFDSYDAPEVITVDGVNQNGIGSYQQGTSVYDTLFVLKNRTTSEGMWLSFDYNGHWKTNAGNFGTNINLSGHVSMTNYAVPDNQSIASPKTVIGVYSGDLDDMGNTIGDYTYRYLWDYTRRDFADGDGTWQWRISPQIPNAFASAAYNRYIGGKVVHIDDNWYDRKGDWNEAIDGDDFQAFNEYINKSGMLLKVWSPFWHADYGSQVLNDHPDWLVGGDVLGFYGLHLNLANASAYSWILNKATAKQTEWGPYLWRYDGQPASKSYGSDNDMLMQSHNFFNLLKAFKDANPLATIEGCGSGGEMLLMEAIRYSDSQQLTDGLAFHYAGYYQSLKLPISKIGHAFSSEPDINTEFSTLDPKDPTVRENTRIYNEFNRYLAAQGLIGRWVKVYRPTIHVGDQTYMLQRTNADQSKAVITFSSYTPYFNSNVTVYPKGLDDTTNYTLNCWKGSCTPQVHTGSYWKTNGVALTGLQRGEVVMFNLSDYPGSGTDTTAPTAPANVMKKTALNVGKFGIELTWTAGTDNRFISYYEIFRNGISVYKVSRGTYDFRIDGSVGDTYQVRTVDGDGNASSLATATLQPGGPTPPTSVPIPDVYQASSGFSSTQGQNNWAYLQSIGAADSMYITNMNWDAANNRWNGDETYARITATSMAPDQNRNAVLKWIAPKDGTVQVSGSVKLAQAGQGGDGIVVRIKKSGRRPYLNSDIWGPYTIGGNDTTGLTHKLVLDVKAGEALYFHLNKNGNPYFDVTNWNPVVRYGTKYGASDGYSTTQGTNQWFYQEWNGSTYNDLAYNPSKGAWQGSQTYLLVGSEFQHPDTFDSVRKWVAPSSGTVSITGKAVMNQTGGDGVNITIKKNSSILWGPTAIAGSDTTTGASHDLLTTVSAGDTLYFIVNKNTNHYIDATLWDPVIFLHH